MNHAEQFAQILERGAQEAPFHEHIRSDGSAVYVPKAASAVGVISLRSMQLPPRVTAARSLDAQQATNAGQLVPLSAALTKNSRVAAAGSVIIVHEPAPDAVVAGNVIAFTERPRRFDLIDAAPFATVSDGDEVATTAAAIARATVAFSGPSYAVRHEISRRDISTYGFDVLSDELMQSIALGLARACDHALLTAIVGKTPGAFAIGAAASAGVDWSELHSFVGTSGSGASAAYDGQLRASGVPATLTPTIAETIVGSFNRTAVAVMDDLRVVVDRRGLHGGLAVTAWVDVVPLLPNESVFWSIQ